MSSFESSPLKAALQDMKEAFLLSVTKRLISKKIPDQKIIEMARLVSATNVVIALRREYWHAHLWNRLKRRFWAA